VSERERANGSEGAHSSSLRPGEPREPDAPRERVPAVCRSLRSKTAFGSDGQDLWRLGQSNTAVYWCLRTMEAFGPDESFCHPHVCGAARACYSPRDDEA
jgi:hypothetical protein